MKNGYTNFMLWTTVECWNAYSMWFGHIKVCVRFADWDAKITNIWKENKRLICSYKQAEMVPTSTRTKLRKLRHTSKIYDDPTS